MKYRYFKTGRSSYATFSHLLDFFDANDLITEVTIPDDAQTRPARDYIQWISDKIILGDRIKLKDLPEWWDIKQCEYMLRQNDKAFQYVKVQTPELCKLAVQENGYALQFVKVQTYELCEIAVQLKGCALQYVKDRFKTYDLCKLAVQQDGYAIHDVKNQTRELCIIAVQKNGFAIEAVRNHTRELCRLALQQDTRAMHYINFKF